MKSPRVRLGLRWCGVLLAVAAIVACGKSPTSPDTGSNGNSSGSGSSFSMKFDGTAWTAVTSLISVQLSANILSIGGSNQSSSTSFAIAMAHPGLTALTPDTYAFGVVNPSNARLVMVGGATALGWSGGTEVGSSGSIKLDTLTATSASGTFSMVLVPVAGTGSTGTKNITEGKFNVKF